MDATSNDSQDIEKTVKPGHTTTEFFMTAAVVVAAVCSALPEALASSEGRPGRPLIVIGALVSAALAALGYSVSRGLAKKG